MKIFDNSENCTFDELAVGDVFTINNSTWYYIRILNYTNSNGYTVNAINLEYGSGYYFPSETIIKKVDATLVIGTVPIVTNQVITKEENETKEESETEKLKKMTLEEIVERCHNSKDTPCKTCPIYPECVDDDVFNTFDNLYTLFNK